MLSLYKRVPPCCVPLVGFVLLAACGGAPSEGEQSTLTEQYERYNQQLDLTDKQFARNERLLDKQEEIADRMLKLVERWERQSDAMDRLVAEPRSGSKQ